MRSCRPKGPTVVGLKEGTVVDVNINLDDLADKIVAKLSIPNASDIATAVENKLAIPTSADVVEAASTQLASVIKEALEALNPPSPAALAAAMAAVLEAVRSPPLPLPSPQEVATAVNTVLSSLRAEIEKTLDMPIEKLVQHLNALTLSAKLNSNHSLDATVGGGKYPVAATVGGGERPLAANMGVAIEGGKYPVAATVGGGERPLAATLSGDPKRPLGAELRFGLLPAKFRLSDVELGLYLFRWQVFAIRCGGTLEIKNEGQVKEPVD